MIVNCGHCHSCGTPLHNDLHGDEWCDNCGTWRRYWSHGWRGGSEIESENAPECPERPPHFCDGRAMFGLGPRGK